MIIYSNLCKIKSYFVKFNIPVQVHVYSNLNMIPSLFKFELSLLIIKSFMFAFRYNVGVFAILLVFKP